MLFMVPERLQQFSDSSTLKTGARCYSHVANCTAATRCFLLIPAVNLSRSSVAICHPILLDTNQVYMATHFISLNLKPFNTVLKHVKLYMKAPPSGNAEEFEYAQFDKAGNSCCRKKRLRSPQRAKRSSMYRKKLKP